MKRRLALIVCLTLLFPALAQAHVGSPDVFFDGMVGAWPAHITIRVPGVVPGRAGITVQVQSKEPVEVTFVPLASGIAISNAPPPEKAVLVSGETNLYSGDLWLMTIGAYSIEVRIHGKSGEASVQIPIDSIARAQLPLPPVLGDILVALGLVLFCGAVAIVAAAAGESTVPAEEMPGASQRRKYWTAGIVTAVLLALALVGGRKWWNAEEKDFRARLLVGGWPDLEADVRVEGAQRILRLTLGRQDLGPNGNLALTPDHGKLLHLFLVGQSNQQAFAHIHPVRKGNETFEVALPPLPEGDYEMFCDLTLDWGFSSTATNSIHLPAIPARLVGSTNTLDADPDDSWAVNSTVAVRETSDSDSLCHLPDGTEVVWNAHAPLRAQRDAALQFQVRDPSGHPATLEAYMGMMSHGAILRSDGLVFSHLHPSGNYSMAAQSFFQNKMAKETGIGSKAVAASQAKMDEWCGPHPADGRASAIALPYEFPSPGNYRIWVQVKTDGQVKTAIFDTTVM